MPIYSVSAPEVSGERAALQLQRLFDRYAIHAGGNWTEETLDVLEEACSRFFGIAPGDFKLWFWAEHLIIRLDKLSYGGLTSRNLIRLNPDHLTAWTVVHELAHAWDAANGWQLSARMAKATGSRFTYPLLHRLFPQSRRFWYAVGSPPPPCGIDANFNQVEDFAESVTAYVYPEEAAKRAEARGWAYESYGFHHFHETLRGKWIDRLVHHK